MNFEKTAPAHIWLGIFGDDEYEFFPADHEGICWAEDQFADLNVGYVREDIAKQTAKQRDELLKALKEAATSLETISILSGRKTFGQPPIETYMDDFMQVRGYANSRMTVAREAIAKAEGGAA